MELVQRRLANLLAVKSIVTVILTVVFAALSWAGRISAEQFMTVFTVVVAFYFGTQAEKRQSAGEPAEPLSGTMVSGESEPAKQA